MSDSAPSRREFFQATVAAAALAEQVIAQTSSASATGIPTRPLGRTGVRVSMIGIGGGHIGGVKEESEGIRIVHSAIDEGVTFMDNAWEYSNGRSEDVMGKALKMDGRRSKVFLMTKVCSREYAVAMQQLEESLRRLQTDHLDLWQFHECNYYNDPEWVFEKGAIRAGIEARKQGKVRFLGFTGHKSPQIHLQMLAKDFEWDTVQMPNNVMDAGFFSFSKEVMPLCLKRNIGIIGMKGCGGDGQMLEKKAVTVDECYRYFLSQPVSVQVCGLAKMEHLREAVRMARAFKPMPKEEMQALQARIRDVQGDGRFELFKSSKRFDSAYHRIQHGFETQGV